ncbi:MAG: PocR ligand-binding domain-containing protein [Clostridia bacterium]|nr:PocR ligand-binding domain-containing protein [Clostridia bacterium]
MLDVMMTELCRATKDFYNMTGIIIVLFDETRRKLYAYPERMCDFCREVRRSEVLTERCLEFDNVGFDMCDRTRKPYIYDCHMGLAEAIAPICEGETVIGYMMMGQILREGGRARVEEAIGAVSRELGLARAPFESDLAAMRETSDEMIRSALSVMTMCVCYLYTNRIVRSRGEDLAARLRAYVDRHYREELTVLALCRMMYISKSKLYHLSLQAFGMGVSDYIRGKRIEEARRLLEEERTPIAQIGARVGFADANYFTRVFRRETGMTPKECRKNAEKIRAVDKL